ncbi:MAG: hypothetical protein FWE14_06165 [Lachnospiraceae bacterium]|nr:hypothetical protein [Lachnospiraceae bacterium]
MFKLFKNVLHFNVKFKVTIIVAVILTVALIIGLMINREANSMLNEIEIFYKEDSIRNSPTMFLTLDEIEYFNITGTWDNTLPLERGEEVGSALDEYGTNWHIFELKGYSKNDYLLVFERDNNFNQFLMSTIAHDVYGTYILENATQKQKLEQLFSIILNHDGTVWLVTPPISSFILVDSCYYTFMDYELIIHYESGEEVARFDIDTDGALVFQSSTVPLHATVGARYVEIHN